MYKLLLLCLTFAFSFNAFSQGIEFPKDKVKITFSIEQKDDIATIIANIKVVPKWHINASKLPSGSFGLPTTFSIDKSTNFEIVGGIIEPKPTEHFDEIAGEQLVYHEGSFELKRKIKVKSSSDFYVSGNVTFQTCNDVKCLPDDFYEYKLQVKGITPKTSSVDIKIESDQDDGKDSSKQSSSDIGTNTTRNIKNIKVDDTKSKNNDESKEDKSLWSIFILSFVSGFAALLTPCVFPMIPMTVSIFTKQSKTKSKGIKNAVLFGISIIAIYIILGSAVTAIFGESALNDMSTNPWFNFIFFLLLVVFAVSFLGAFEIQMPSSWINKADSQADKGGLIGIFFMALVLALVSFSCTGPIVGTLIVEAARQGGITPIVGMFGFSFALAIPFMLFAAFPGWMNSLPKSGGWLNTVKVFLGFLELALAFKFLSNADMTWDLHLLEREMFIAIWIAIFGTLTLYMFGKLRMPHDSPVEKLSVGRVLIGLTSLIFVIYMIPGMWGAPLKIISAFPPPPQYSESPLGFGGSSIANTPKGEIIEGTELGPQNIYVFHDYDKALEYAKKVKKPLFIDFTGINCVNCRKMEQQIWGEPGIIEKLRDEVVIASLHVDEKKLLPKNEQGEFKTSGDNTMTVKYTGDKWKLMEITRYNILAQPYYVMQDFEGNDLSNGSADFEHTYSAKKFKKWLDSGIREFKNKYK